ncbi:nicotinate phosphoribosyltransferase-like protein [Leptotrombidium deliense]|uniref:Nicotinate phosphoribosyltransferase n=1 Tax=Leptotrombidium deliense TaxID=299467 RepID=A0A443SUC4_9ACAR|nr:nicotinate phosphoribosyltransferase-like protein [Leptotrombidium deliense]
MSMDCTSFDHVSNKSGNFNNIVQPLLTDLYQVTMAYGYWKSKKTDERAVFDLFFRKNPFQGEFTIFAGLEEILKFLENFKFSSSDLQYLKSVLPSNTEPEFFTYLSGISAKDVTLYAVPEGSLVFPRVPILVVEGPLPVVQLLETILLTLCNYASLLTTNAVRYRIAAGDKINLFEFGLRRAQGPDGGLSASKYAYMGGFDGTSNLLAGKLFNIPVKGTHAHAFVMSYSSLRDLPSKILKHKSTNEEIDFVALCKNWHKDLSIQLNLIGNEASEGELAAFVAYAIAFPDCFMALVDTYDVLRSGMLNFCAVAMALNELNYRAVGVRIDSGDLAYLSDMTAQIFRSVASSFNVPWFEKLEIVASNDINEDTIYSLNEQGHKITTLGIGTHLVTCQRQPALGCVYKLVEVNERSCIKVSEDMEKVTIPGRKNVFRLYGKDGSPLLDLLTQKSEEAPKEGHRVLCRHPFMESKRAYVTPTRVELLLQKWWSDGQICQSLPTLDVIRKQVRDSVTILRSDIKRYLNPTPYKVSISESLYHFMHDLWLQHAPVGELA